MQSVDSDAVDSRFMRHDHADDVLDSVASEGDGMYAYEDDRVDDAESPLARSTSTIIELPDRGSSLPGAIFNFTNSIIGAGCIGLGGAIAVSGGVVSIFLILFFGVLTKVSLDMVIRLSVETEGAHGSYEDLAKVGLGSTGRLLVLACKFLYSFGCLVAYIIVVKDNFAPALRSLMFGHHATTEDGFVHVIHEVLRDNDWTTWILSATIILPLCLLRDMTPLSHLSMLSVISMIAIVGIVIYIFFAHPELHQDGGSVYEKWFEIKPGVVESLGTFVFTFVSQHTVHLVYGSLRPTIRSVSNWKIVSSTAVSIASAVSLSVGIFVYMTFWDKTESDIFAIYPESWMINLAKLLLCVTMLFTFPLPFFTCRELLIIIFIHPFCKNDVIAEDALAADDLQEPLIVPPQDHDRDADNISLSTTLSRLILSSAAPTKWLLPDDERQLQLVGHIALTAKLWFVTTMLAIASPSLGDILDLVGCASGTMIAFVLPSIISFRLEGYSHLAMFVLAIGGVVGTVGTFFSVKKLLQDVA